MGARKVLHTPTVERDMFVKVRRQRDKLRRENNRLAHELGITQGQRGALEMGLHQLEGRYAVLFKVGKVLLVKDTWS